MRNILISVLFVITSLSAYPVSDQIREQALKYREQGYQFQRRGDFRQALSYYLKAVNTDPTLKEAYNDLGVAYEKKGNLDKAEQAYLKAIEIDEDYLPPYANLGFLYEKRQEFLKASHYWQERWERGKEGSYWKKKAGDHLVMLDMYPPVKYKRMQDAASKFSQKLEIKREQDRGQAEKLIQAGQDALGKGLYEQALRDFLSAKKLGRSDPELLAKAQDYVIKTEKYHRQAKIRSHLESGIRYLEEGNYLVLMQELNKALDLILETQ